MISRLKSLVVDGKLMFKIRNSALIDVLAGMAVIWGAVDKSPKAIAICKAVQFAKDIKDKQEEPEGREVLEVRE